MSGVIIPKRGQFDRQSRKHQTRTGVHARSRMSLVVPFFIVSLAIPLLFYIGPLRLSLYRLLLVVLFFPLVAGWLSGKAGRIRLADVSIVMLCIWYTLALFVVDGPDVAIEASGIFFVESLGSYLLARCAIRTADEFHSMVKWLFRVILCLLPFALYEALTGQNVILDFFNRIATSYPDVNMQPRWGFDRVQGPFEHPILFGVFGGGALALSYYVLGYGKGFLGRMLRPALVFFTAALSMSSGPVTSFVAQLGMIGWDVLLTRVRARWWILLVLVSLGWIALEIPSNRSVPAIFIQTFAFNPWTGYQRLYVWQYGSASVLNYPVFGLGLFPQWERPQWLTASMDMYWLLWAVRIGIPGVFFMLLALGSTVIGVIRKNITNPRVNAYRLGFLIVMLGFFMAGWTVHYWNATHAFFFFLLGSGGWFLDIPADPVQNGDAAQRRTRAAQPSNSLTVAEHTGEERPQRQLPVRRRSGYSRSGSDK